MWPTLRKQGQVNATAAVCIAPKTSVWIGRDIGVTHFIPSLQLSSEEAAFDVIKC